MDPSACPHHKGEGSLPSLTIPTFMRFSASQVLENAKKKKSSFYPHPRTSLNLHQILPWIFILILSSFYLHFILISGLNEVHETGCGSQNLISLISKAGLQLAESQKKTAHTRSEGRKNAEVQSLGHLGRADHWLKAQKLSYVCIYI